MQRRRRGWLAGYMQPRTQAIAGYMCNARRNPRSLQYYSRVDVPSTVTPQRLREGDDLQERCVLGSKGFVRTQRTPPGYGPGHHTANPIGLAVAGCAGCLLCPNEVYYHQYGDFLTLQTCTPNTTHYFPTFMGADIINTRLLSIDNSVK